MSRDPRDWQADMGDCVQALKDCKLSGYEETDYIECAMYWLHEVKTLKEDNARWLCKHTAAEQKYLTQSNVIAELRGQVNRADKALQEIIEHSKHDGISKHLDNCYVTARHAISTLYPLDMEDTE